MQVRGPEFGSSEPYCGKRKRSMEVADSLKSQTEERKREGFLDQWILLEQLNLGAEDPFWMSKVEPEQGRLPTHPGAPIQVYWHAHLCMYVYVTGMYTRTSMSGKHTFVHKNAKTITQSWTLQTCLIVERKASQRWEKQRNGSIRNGRQDMSLRLIIRTADLVSSMWQR